MLEGKILLHPLPLRGPRAGTNAHLGFHLAVASRALTLFTGGTLEARLADAAPIAPTLQGLGTSRVAGTGCRSERHRFKGACPHLKSQQILPSTLSPCSPPTV